MMPTKTLHEGYALAVRRDIAWGTAGALLGALAIALVFQLVFQNNPSVADIALKMVFLPALGLLGLRLGSKGYQRARRGARSKIYEVSPHRVIRKNAKLVSQTQEQYRMPMNGQLRSSAYQTVHHLRVVRSSTGFRKF